MSGGTSTIAFVLSPPIMIRVVIDTPTTDLLITVALALALWAVKPDDAKAWVRRHRRGRNVTGAATLAGTFTLGATAVSSAQLRLYGSPSVGLADLR